MGFFATLIAVGSVLLLAAVVWVVWAWAEVISLPQVPIASPEPSGSDSDAERIYRGQVLEWVTISIKSEVVTVRWKFRKQYENSGFKVTVDVKEGASYGSPIIETHNSSYVEERMKYGDGKVFRVTVTKEYTAIWGLAWWWSRTMQFDAITMSARIGALKERIGFLSDVKQAAILDREAATETLKTQLAAYDIQKRANQLLESGKDGMSRLGNANYPDKIISLRKERKSAIDKIRASTDIDEIDKEELIQRINSRYDHKEMAEDSDE